MVDVDTLTVGRRSFRGVRVRDVLLEMRRTLIQLGFPPFRARLEVERVEHPSELRSEVFRCASRNASASLRARGVGSRHDRGQLRIRLLPDGGGDEHKIAPDNRRSPSLPGKGDLPGHVLCLAPAIRERWVVGNHAACQAAELWPVVSGSGVDGEPAEEEPRYNE